MAPVTAYQHTNYRGYSVQFEIGSHLKSQIVSLGGKNNDLSSIRISPGYKVTLYRDDNFQGTSYQLTSARSDFGKIGWNDKVSSLKVEQLDHRITVYQHTNYRGYSVSFETGSYSKSQIVNLGGKNNDISSVKVDPGYKVTLYTGDNFQGGSLELTADRSNLHSIGWGDKTSSLEVEEVSTLPAPTIYNATQHAAIYSAAQHASVSLLMEKSDGLYVGSGFIIRHDSSSNYYICTVAHNVLENDRNTYASKIVASVSTADNAYKAVECSVVGVAGYADIAILKMNTTIPNLTHLSWATNSTNIGDVCYVIGDPLGVDAISFCQGNIRDTKYVFENIIKSVCISNPIYGGNSGSCILDGAGEVIGIISYGFVGTDSISWGAHHSVIEHVSNYIITNHESSGSISNFIGGTLNAELRPIDSYYGYSTGQVSGTSDFDLQGYYVSSIDGSSPLTTSDVVTKLDDQLVGLHNSHSTLTDIYLSPSTSLSLHLNNDASATSMTTSLLSVADDIFLGGGADVEHRRKTRLCGPVKKT